MLAATRFWDKCSTSRWVRFYRPISSGSCTSRSLSRRTKPGFRTCSSGTASPSRTSRVSSRTPSNLSHQVLPYSELKAGWGACQHRFARIGANLALERHAQLLRAAVLNRCHRTVLKHKTGQRPQRAHRKAAAEGKWGLESAVLRRVLVSLGLGVRIYMSGVLRRVTYSFLFSVF